jgi:hypothetical protein
MPVSEQKAELVALRPGHARQLDHIWGLVADDPKKIA